MWNALLEAGKAEGLIPAGLGARNTLRLEAGYALYGHELDEETTLLEANLGWIAKTRKGRLHRPRCPARQRARGTRKKLMGFEMTGPGIARDGYDRLREQARWRARDQRFTRAVFEEEHRYGLTCLSAGESGGEIEIEIRGRRAGARIVPLPFYKRPKSRIVLSDRASAKVPKIEIRPANCRVYGERERPMYPPEFLYTKEHEWIRVDEYIGTIGITDYAQKELGDVVFVELPKARRPRRGNESPSGRSNPSKPFPRFTPR